MSDKRIGVIQAEVRRGIYVGPGTDSSGTELSTEPIHEASKKTWITPCWVSLFISEVITHNPANCLGLEKAPVYARMLDSSKKMILTLKCHL